MEPWRPSGKSLQRGRFVLWQSDKAQHFPLGEGSDDLYSPVAEAFFQCGEWGTSVAGIQYLQHVCLDRHDAIAAQKHRAEWLHP